jgi:hypothetical protein
VIPEALSVNPANGTNAKRKKKKKKKTSFQSKLTESK